MHEPDSGSKTSPLLWLLMLSGLSLASVIVTFTNDEIPGVTPEERDVASTSTLEEVQQELRKALLSIEPRSLFCQDSASIIERLNFGSDRKAISPSPQWIEQRRQLPQAERDAWSRCVAAEMRTQDIRRKLCFHVTRSSQKSKIWDADLNLIELTLEWHQPQIKRPVSCQEWQAAGVSEPELLVYYSVYSGMRKGESWDFRRLTGGLRLLPRWQQARAP
jgi:hypothetical protein